MRNVILLIILIFITISCGNDNKFISLFLITNEINVGQNRIALSIIDSEGTSLKENIEMVHGGNITNLLELLPELTNTEKNKYQKTGSTTTISVPIGNFTF